MTLQKLLFLCHIFNIGIYSITWVPYILVHVFNYLLRLDFYESEFISVFFPTLVALTPLLNSLTRVYFDPFLKHKLLCRHRR